MKEDEERVVRREFWFFNDYKSLNFVIVLFIVLDILFVLCLDLID